jgi:hypothetical protein
VNEPSPAPPATPPPDESLVKPAWIVIFAGWAILLLPVPFTGWIGWLTGCVAGSVLAVINLSRGLAGVGLAQLACAVVGSFVFYWIGLTVLAGIAVAVFSG